jgi:hypothetical protein
VSGEWNGLPPDPTQDGWHWLRYSGRPFLWHWNAIDNRWATDFEPSFVAEHFAYVAPCPYPEAQP